MLRLILRLDGKKTRGYLPEYYTYYRKMRIVGERRKLPTLDATHKDWIVNDIEEELGLTVYHNKIPIIRGRRRGYNLPDSWDLDKTSSIMGIKSWKTDKQFKKLSKQWECNLNTNKGSWVSKPVYKEPLDVEKTFIFTP